MDYDIEQFSARTGRLIKENNTVVNVADSLSTGGLISIGYKAKVKTALVTRPNDTTAYTIGDAITNSTSVPTVFSVDLSSQGAIAGQAIEIRGIEVVSSVKQSLLPLINVILSPTTFTATNDNSALSIDDATMTGGAKWFNCATQNYTAVNSSVSKENVGVVMVLAAADTKLYGTLQAANAYIPTGVENFTVVITVALL